MSIEEISDRVRSFLLEYIHSVEQLRVLLLLFESPDKEWTVSELTRELRSTEGSIARRLDDLCDRKVLSSDPNKPGTHSFSRVGPGLGDVIRELAETNKARPYSVIELIYARPNEALRAFADAFRFKKDGKP